MENLRTLRSDNLCVPWPSGAGVGPPAVSPFIRPADPGTASLRTRREDSGEQVRGRRHAASDAAGGVDLYIHRREAPQGQYPLKSTDLRSGPVDGRDGLEASKRR